MQGVLVRGIATFGFVGCLPKAPGTWASAAALLLWWFFRPGSGLIQLAIVSLIVVAGTLAAHRAEAVLGHDDRRIVIDEVAGSLLAVLYLPARPGILVAGFLLFRLFDIAKPPPVYQLQALPGGLGVMADDIAAGLLANLLLRLALLLLPGLAEAIP